MVVRRAPLHVVAMRLRVVTEGQRVAGLAERMAGQGATQAGRRDETHPWLGRGPGGGLYGTLHGDATRQSESQDRPSLAQDRQSTGGLRPAITTQNNIPVHREAEATMAKAIPS